MSLPWLHHVACRAPLSKDYSFKVFENGGLYSVVAQYVTDKKGWDGFPNGYFFYPKNRQSRSECEAIIEELQKDLAIL